MLAISGEIPQIIAREPIVARKNGSESEMHIKGFSLNLTLNYITSGRAAISEISFAIEYDLTKCEQIWKDLSPHVFLTDMWEYRLAFHQAFSKTPHFICAVQNAKIIGVLPLEHLDLNGGFYSYFGGGEWNERLRAFLSPGAPPKLIQKLYELAPRPAYFHSVMEADAKGIPNIRLETETYYLDCHDLNYNIDNLYAKWSKSYRHSIKRDFRKIEELKPEIIWDRFEDIESMIRLNKERFNGDSTFNKPHFADAIRNLVNCSILRPHLGMISLKLNHELIGVALCGFYKNSSIYLASGNIQDIPSVNKYLVFQLVQESMRRKIDRILMLSYDCGWKEHWHLNKETLYFTGEATTT
jgi:hypothetical protein